MNKDKLPVIKGFEAIPCRFKRAFRFPMGKRCDSTCRYWIKSEKYSNCSITAANEGPLTLKEIADIFELSEARISQIEQKILKGLRNHPGILKHLLYRKFNQTSFGSIYLNDRR